MKKFVEFGIYTFIFFLPWQTRWIFQAGKINGGASEYLTESLYGVDILLIGLLILAVMNFRKNILTSNAIASIYPFMEARMLLIFLALGVVSIFWAQDKTLALYREAQIILALGFFWLIANFTKISKLALSFVASLILPTLLGLWQFFTQTTFANKWLGLAQHQAGVGGTSVVETFSSGIVDARWLRAYGSFDHPNILGATLAVGILIITILLLRENKLSEVCHSRASGNLGSNAGLDSLFQGNDIMQVKLILRKRIYWLRLFLLFSLVLFSTGLFVSFSRSAWLGLILGIVFIAVSLFLQKKFLDLKNLIFAGVLIGVVFSIMSLGYHDLVGVRIGGSTRLESLSFDQRALYLQQAKGIIARNPIFGTGIGNYIPTLLKLNPSNQIWTYQPVHNVFLLAWAELGIFGMLFLVAFLGNLFWQFGRKSLISGALLIAILPMLWLDHWFWSFHYGMMFFAIVVSLAVSFSRKEKV